MVVSGMIVRFGWGDGSGYLARASDALDGSSHRFRRQQLTIVFDANLTERRDGRIDNSKDASEFLLHALRLSWAHCGNLHLTMSIYLMKPRSHLLGEASYVLQGDGIRIEVDADLARRIGRPFYKMSTGNAGLGCQGVGHAAHAGVGSARPVRKQNVEIDSGFVSHGDFILRTSPKRIVAAVQSLSCPT